MGLLVVVLGERGGEEKDLYAKWKSNSSKSLSVQEESTMRR
jgi:hypothetical protein